MRRPVINAVLVGTVAIAMYAVSGVIARAQTPLAIDSARITISGTSNIHTYTASTTTIHVTRSEVAAAFAGPEFWTEVLKPGAVEAFEVAIPARTLTSPREGLDKNMYKALKVEEHADITFRLLRLETAAKADGCARATGMLRIAGIEKEVAIDVTTSRHGSTLSVEGSVNLLMTDYGIKPPTAMLGMLKTDPKVTVTFETVLTIPRT
jgi:polyisoprenoid-binding protein YceI